MDEVSNLLDRWTGDFSVLFFFILKRGNTLNHIHPAMNSMAYVKRRCIEPNMLSGVAV